MFIASWTRSDCGWNRRAADELIKYESVYFHFNAFVIFYK